MITKLTMRCFKSLQRVELELGQINLLVGANGSGKSNLLEAIGVLAAASSGRVDDESLLRRGVRPGVPGLYKSAFPYRKEDSQPHIFFGARNSGASYEVSLWNPISDPKPAWRFKSEKLERGSGDRIVGRSPYRKEQLEPGKELNPEQGLAALKAVELKHGDPALALLDTLRNFSIYCANTATLRGLVPDQQARVPVGLSGGRLPEAILELLRARWHPQNEHLKEGINEILPLIDWAKSFGSAPSASVPLSPSAAASKMVVKFRDRFMAEKRNVLTGYDASEGALYVLFVAILALHPGAPVCFAVDNIDQALNPRLAMKVAQVLCKWTINSIPKRQLLITGHNPALLDGLPLQNEAVRLFAVDRDNSGHTVISRIEITEKMLSRAKEGWTLSRMWMNGLIGGVPNI